MNTPAELKYSKEHEWVKLEGNIAYVGITDFAQSELGDIVYVDIENVGGNVSSGEVFGSIEAVKTVSDLFSPISGKIVEFNTNLESDPEKVNQDPYNEGWIIKIEASDLNELNNLLTSSEYISFIGK
ncbi:MAG: glycine cleavage system protein GcvH [Solirubrobacteraceae bacterium]